MTKHKIAWALMEMLVATLNRQSRYRAEIAENKVSSGYSKFAGVTLTPSSEKNHLNHHVEVTKYGDDGKVLMHYLVDFRNRKSSTDPIIRINEDPTILSDPRGKVVMLEGKVNTLDPDCPKQLLTAIRNYEKQIEEEREAFGDAFYP